MQPYGCGCVLLRDPAVGRFYKHDSPFTYFTSGALHLGKISLECSRAGASAVALWTTQRLLPLVRGGVFAAGLAHGRAAALELYRRIAASPHFIAPIHPPQLDVVFWAVAAATLEESSALAQAIFDEAAQRSLHLALPVPVTLLSSSPWSISSNPAADSTVLCLRSVPMKLQHLLWIERVWTLLEASAATCKRRADAFDTPP